MTALRLTVSALLTVVSIATQASAAADDEPARFSLDIAAGIGQTVPPDAPVHGLAVNVAYGVHSEIEGLQLGVIQRVHGDSTGMQAGVINHADAAFRGTQLGVFNHTGGRLNGRQVGLVNRVHSMQGEHFGVVSVSDVSEGEQFGALVGWSGETKGAMWGFLCAAGISDSLIGIFSFSGHNRGSQFAVLNAARKDEGLQLGAINWSREKTGNIQLGALNVVESNPWYARILPLFNADLRADPEDEGS